MSNKDVVTDEYSLLFGDCLERMKEIPSGSVDLILTDPPYQITSCDWDSIIPFEPMWNELKRIIKPNGAVVLFGAEPFSSLLRCSNIKDFKYDWVWEKSKATGFLNSKRQPLRAHEIISVFYSKPPTYTPQMTEGVAYNKGVRKEQTQNDVYGSFDQVEVKSDGLRFPRSVQYFKTAESEGSFHKTQKPVALLEYLIKTYTQEGETVLDFAAGSFSTGVACVNLNRKGIMIEKDPRYFEVGSERVMGALSENVD